jgi:hypothetical protein
VIYRKERNEDRYSSHAISVLSPTGNRSMLYVNIHHKATSSFTSRFSLLLLPASGLERSGILSRIIRAKLFGGESALCPWSLNESWLWLRISQYDPIAPTNMRYNHDCSRFCVSALTGSLSEKVRLTRKASFQCIIHGISAGTKRFAF